MHYTNWFTHHLTPARLIGCAVLVLSLGLGGCPPGSTPVTPAPLAAQEQQQVAAALLGAWKATHSKQGDRDKKEEGDVVEFEFRADGKYRHVIEASLAAMDEVYGYKLDGRNLVTDSPQGTYRVNSVDAQHLELFSYDFTTTWYLERKSK